MLLIHYIYQLNYDICANVLMRIQLIQLRLTTIVKWQMCNMHERKNDGNNIVLNKINTSAALLDYKYTI